MKCSLDISNFLEEISGLSYSIVFLSFFALFTLFSLQVMSDSFATPWAVALQAPLSTGFPGKNTGPSCHFLLQDCSLRKAFLSLLVILWNSAFKWVYHSFSPWLSLIFFSQLFVRPPQTTILPFCISFSLGWFWSQLPIQCHEPLSIVLRHSIRSNPMSLFVISTV